MVVSRRQRSLASTASFTVDISLEKKFIFDRNDEIKIKVTLSKPTTSLLTISVSGSGLLHQSDESMDIASGASEKEFTLTTDNSDKNSEAQYIEELTVRLTGSNEFAGLTYCNCLQSTKNKFHNQSI